MAKKENNKDFEINSSVSSKITNGFKYLDNAEDADLNSGSYIPEHVFPPLSEFVRGIRKVHDVITEKLDSVDKASPEYDTLSRQREELVSSLVTAKSQITSLNSGTLNLKQTMPNLSRGSQASHLYNNTVVYAGQSDAVFFTEAGKMIMGLKGSTGKIEQISLDQMKGAKLVTEPMGSKSFVWKMAERTKQDAASGKSFDGDWTYTRIYNDLTEGGPQNTVGMAYTDMAGDNMTKSFSEMWDDGLQDPFYYVNPETGESLQGISSEWMKDQENNDMLKKFLGKYITNVMKDIHSPVIDTKTGLVDKTQSQRADELIKKYRK